MQSSNAPTKLKLPFASSGGKNAIPNTSQIGIVAGAASYPDGFPQLTRTPLVAGGVPPSGLDMNGVLFEMTAIARWLASGAGFTYDGAWASDSNVGGYPKGARVMRSDGVGYWLNTTDNNTTDPEAGGAGWVPDYTHGTTAVTMTSSNVTLTALQYGKPIIVITGTLTANLNLIFPNIAGRWAVVNNTTGAFTITAKTVAGSGVVVTGSQSVVGDGTDMYSTSGMAGITQAQADARYCQIGYMLVQDQKASGTEGGSSTSGTQTRTINTTVANTISGASLASNQITLPAGTYRVRGSSTNASGVFARTWLRNVTDSTVAAQGGSAAGYNVSVYPSMPSEFVGRFTITGPKVFDVQHYSSQAIATIGLGRAVSSGAVEIYTTVEIIKES